jgi:Flp pilus assembly protein TadD
VADGIARYQDGQYAAAAGIFARLLQAAPDDAALLRLSGLSLVRAGRRRRPCLASRVPAASRSTIR